MRNHRQFIFLGAGLLANILGSWYSIYIKNMALIPVFIASTIAIAIGWNYLLLYRKLQDGSLALIEYLSGIDLECRRNREPTFPRRYEEMIAVFPSDGSNEEGDV